MVSYTPGHAPPRDYRTVKSFWLGNHKHLMTRVPLTRAFSAVRPTYIRSAHIL